jgi:hypothetical protein
VTIVGDTSGTWVGSTNGIGLQVLFGLGVGTTYSGTAGAWGAANYISATGAVSVVGTSGATFYITGVQLEAGTVATPFERQIYGTQLAQCQRYYQRIGDSTSVLFGDYVSASSDFYQTHTLQTEMRIAPTATRVGTWTLGNINSQPSFTTSSKTFRVNANATVTGFSYVQAGTSIYVAFDAEL